MFGQYLSDILRTVAAGLEYPVVAVLLLLMALALVLAVGMMLALVVAWNVDIINTSPDNKTPDEAQAVSEMNPAEFTPDENEQTLDENELREYGTVYVDKDGNYYVVEGGNGE